MDLVEFEQKIYLRLIEKSYLFGGEVPLDALADTAIMAARILEDKQKERYINNLPFYDPQKKYDSFTAVQHNGKARIVSGVGSLGENP